MNPLPFLKENKSVLFTDVCNIYKIFVNNENLKIVLKCA